MGVLALHKYILFSILFSIASIIMFSSMMDNLSLAISDTPKISNDSKPMISIFFDNDELISTGQTKLYDESNHALLLDGNKSYFSLNSPEFQSNEFSISAWIKPEYKKGVSSTLSIISQDHTFDLSIKNDNVSQNTLVFSVYDGIRWHSVTSHSSIPEKWTHVSASFSDNSLKIFVNGFQENSVNLDNNYLLYHLKDLTNYKLTNVHSKGTLLIGGFNPSLRIDSTVKNNFSGLIDDVLIYDEAISSDKILELAKNRSQELVLKQEISEPETQLVGTPNQYGFVTDTNNPNDQKTESAASQGFKVQKKQDKNKISTTEVPICGQSEYRTIDGTCNNIANPLFGSAGIKLLRLSPVGYDDGDSEPITNTRPSAREISNVLAAQSGDILNQKGASDFVWQWGQFLDHDIDLTTTTDEPFDIIVPSGDPFFDPNGSGLMVIHLTRSIHNDESPRQQINQITSYIDASNVYGSDENTALSLRDPINPGKLLVSEGNLLPESGGFFKAGDVRANEQIALTAMHTLFVREHNRLADQIANEHPDYTDEQIYQTARKIVGAEIQVITYNEFLPMLLGSGAIPEYSGYDSSIDATIANEFSTASYRYGHSQLSPNLLEMDKSGMSHVPLRDAFFNPDLFKEIGLDSILRGLATQRAQEIDTKVVDDVRNFLFGEPGSGGFDLASLNIQRGRDHGLADYNSVRQSYRLTPVSSFDEITKDTDLQEKLQSLYGSVKNIDLWVGGLAEDHAPGSMVGETIKAVLTDQFTRLRDGDRFWYQNDPFFIDYKVNMKKVEDITLYDIISYNTDLQGKIQKDVFFCQDPHGGGHNIMHSELRNICSLD